MLRGLVTAVLVFAIDQLSKVWMMNSVLEDTTIITQTSFFNLVRAWNTGVSFSMFNSWGVWGVLILSLIAFVIVGVLLFWLKKEQIKMLQVSIGFIIGGAIGNVVDRVRFGAVFDFLDFHWGENHWPAFNAADAFICVGATIIILHSFFEKPKQSLKEAGKVN